MRYKYHNYKWQSPLDTNKSINDLTPSNLMRALSLISHHIRSIVIHIHIFSFEYGSVCFAKAIGEF